MHPARDTLRDARPGRTSRFIDALDRLIHPDRLAAGGEERRRLRILVGVTGFGFAVMTLRLLHALGRSPPRDVLIIAIGWITAASLVVAIRRGAPSFAIGHALASLALGGNIVLSATHEAIHATSTLSLVALPVVMTVTIGRRAGVVWASVSLAALAALWSLTEGDPDFATEKALGLGFGTILLTGTINVFELLRRRALAELAYARDQAQQLAEAKSRFLANMSHEIRTPMNGVLGMLGILLETPLDDDQLDYARTAHASGRSLLDVLNDILDYSKLDAGQMRLDLAPTDLRAVAEGVVDQLAITAADKGLELIIHYRPGTPVHVLADGVRLRQVLLNLVGNAIKFTDRGHVLITIDHAPSAEGPPRFRCAVQDTGVGIPAHQQHAVFEQFQQVDASASRAHAGTGLGLAIVRELVQLMDGRVELDSAPRRGTTFTIELSLEPSPAPPARDRADRADRADLADLADRADRADLAGLRLLVVDDNPVNRRVLREQLSPWVAAVDDRASGAQALAALTAAHARGEAYHLALLDHHMPEMDGFALAAAIQADPDLRPTVRILLGSITDRSPTEALRRVGLVAQLAKPVRPSALIDQLSAAWAEREHRRTNPPDRQRRVSRPPWGTAWVARRLRVLVVEDNAVNQKVAVRMLENLGCQVDVANDGREAVERTASARYDLVFMDVQMPTMDGLEATARIRRREDPIEPALIIVAVTAHAMDSDRERCLSAGMDDYISKPIERAALVRILDGLGALDVRPSPRPDGEPSPARLVPRGAQPPPRG